MNICNRLHPMLMSDKEEDGNGFGSLISPSRNFFLTNLCRKISERCSNDSMFEAEIF